MTGALGDPTGGARWGFGGLWGTRWGGTGFRGFPGAGAAHRPPLSPPLPLSPLSPGRARGGPACPGAASRHRDSSRGRDVTTRHCRRDVTARPSDVSPAAGNALRPRGHLPVPLIPLRPRGYPDRPCRPYPLCPALSPVSLRVSPSPHVPPCPRVLPCPQGPSVRPCVNVMPASCKTSLGLIPRARGGERRSSTVMRCNLEAGPRAICK